MLCYCTTTRRRCVPIFSKDDRVFFVSDKILMINRLVAKFLTSDKDLFRRINV